MSPLLHQNGCRCTECVNSSVSRFGQKLLLKFLRPACHTTAAVQPGKKKIARRTSAKCFYQALRLSELLAHFCTCSSSKVGLLYSPPSKVVAYRKLTCEKAACRNWHELLSSCHTHKCQIQKSMGRAATDKSSVLVCNGRCR